MLFEPILPLQIEGNTKTTKENKESNPSLATRIQNPCYICSGMDKNGFHAVVVVVSDFFFISKSFAQRRVIIFFFSQNEEL
jgi:hypothetical protein